MCKKEYHKYLLCYWCKQKYWKHVPLNYYLLSNKLYKPYLLFLPFPFSFPPFLFLLLLERGEEDLPSPSSLLSRFSPSSSLPLPLSHFISQQCDISFITEDIWRTHCHAFLNMKDLDNKGGHNSWKEYYQVKTPTLLNSSPPLLNSSPPSFVPPFWFSTS